MSRRSEARAFEDDAPGPSETPHAFLRRVTRQWHERVEAAFARFDLQEAEGLGGFLRQQAMAFIPLERVLEDVGVDRILPDWPLRRRSAALLADLHYLGIAPPPSPAAPSLPSDLHALGALYVLEGSRLGGRILHRRVAASPNPNVRGADRFLAHRHDHGWTTFLTVLDGVAPVPVAMTALCEGARSAFGLFVSEPNGGTDTGSTSSVRSGLVQIDAA